MIDKEELESLLHYWMDRKVHGPTESARRYAAGNAAALNLIWKTLYSGASYTIREWVEMEGPDEVRW